MNFKRTNNMVGWVICIIACFVYIKTMEATGSLWDCGEFISSAYKVQIPHPPGAPLFVLLGRLFSMFLKPSDAALGVNTMTALASVEVVAGFVIPHRLRACADDIPLMDMGALRIRGRAVVVGEWEPAPDGEICIGTLLRPTLLGAPQIVELTDYLPQVRTAT